jgi:hypothetical protein
VCRVEAESLLLVLELNHLAGFEKALQSYRSERLIFHGPSEFLARTGKKPGPLLSLCAHGNARFRLKTPGQCPGGPKAISYQSVFDFRAPISQFVHET